MKKWTIMAFIFTLAVPVMSQAGETLISTVTLKPNRGLIKCQMSSNVTEDYDRVDSLKCWEMNGEKRGRLIYEYSGDLFAMSLKAVSNSLLLSEWGGGSADCYKVIDFGPKEPRVILDNESDESLCSKGKMEIALGQKGEVAFLLEQFDGGTSRDETKAFCLKSGKLSTKIVSLIKRFEWLEENCWGISKPE